MHHLGLFPSQWNEANRAIDGTRSKRIEFLPSAFLGDDEQRCPFASIVLDRAVPSLNPGETAIAVTERGFVRIKKTFRVRDNGRAGVRIFTAVIPDENTAAGHHAFRICLVRPQVDKITAMA